MLIMAKRDPKKDRHKKDQFSLRLSEDEREAADRISTIEERSLTTVIRRALRLYAKQNGYDWPGVPGGDSDPDS